MLWRVPVYTSCRDCKFAQWKQVENSDKTEQVGCKLNRLDTWRGLGKLEQVELGNQIYHVIPDRICNGYNPHEDCSYEEARKVIELDYTMVLEYGPNTQAELDRINNYRIKPKTIMVVCKGGGWNVQKSLKSEIPFYTKEYLEHYDLAVYDVMARSERMYAISGENEAFVEAAERIYNDELVHFISLKEGDNLLLEVRAFRYLGTAIFEHELAFTLKDGQINND